MCLRPHAFVLNILNEDSLTLIVFTVVLLLFTVVLRFFFLCVLLFLWGFFLFMMFLGRDWVGVLTAVLPPPTSQFSSFSSSSSRPGRRGNPWPGGGSHSSGFGHIRPRICTASSGRGRRCVDAASSLGPDSASSNPDPGEVASSPGPGEHPSCRHHDC